MSGRSLAGFLALDVLLLATGYALLLAFLGRFGARRALLLGGVAFWAGTAVVGLLLTLLAVLTSVGPRPWIVVATCALVGAGCAPFALRRRAAEPPEPADRFGIVAAAFAAAAGVMFVGLLAAVYHRPVTEWDAWSFWVPKAKLLYFAGELDPDTFTTFPGTTYPILVPVLHAAGFGFAGSADDTSLHVQSWVFFAAFAWAVVGLLRPHVPHVLVWPFVLVLAVVPEFGRLFAHVDGDFPSFFLFVLGGLALLRWIEREERWTLATGLVLLATSASVKREGTVYVLAAGAAALAVTLPQARRRWPVLGLGLVAVLATTLPWRLWLRGHSVAADSQPPSGVLGDATTSDGGGRLLDATWTVLEHVFSVRAWSVAPWAGLVLVVAGLLLGRRRPAVFVLTASGVVFAALVWRLLWYGGEDEPENSSIPRVAGVISMLALAAAPLLCHALLGRASILSVGLSDRRRLLAGRVAFPFAVLPAVAYLAVGVGRGDYEFTADACKPRMADARELVVVLARPASYRDAVSTRDEARAAGLSSAEIGFDACGELRVGVDGLTSVAAALAVQAKARPAGYAPVVEGSAFD